MGSMRQTQATSSLLRLCLLSFVLGLMALRPAHVSAHANLVQSDPPAEAVLARSPARVQLSFSEAVEPRDIDVRVVNGQRQRVDRGDAALLAGTKDSVGASVNDALPAGIYTVQWKMVSAVDGHATAGTFPFTVGEPGAVPSAAATTVESSASSGGLLGVIARWVTLLAAVVLAGSFAFVPLMLTRALQLLDGLAGPNRSTSRDPDAAVPPDAVDKIADRAADRLQWIACFALAAYAVGLVLVLLVDTATANGTGYIDALGRPMWDRLTGSAAGHRWLVRGGLLVLIGVGLYLLDRDVRGRGRAALTRWWSWWGLAGLAAATLLIESLGSHSAALTSQTKLATAIDWVHLLAVSLWVGGLAQLGLAFLPALAPLGGPPRTRLLAALIPRFSLIAGGSVGVILLTGIYQTVRLLGGWSAFTDQAWGETLLVKLGLFGVLILLAAFNLLMVRPWLARLANRLDRPARETAARVRLHFRRALLGEAGVAVLVLLVVGVLTGRSPGKTAGALAEGPVRPIILQNSVEGLMGRIVITPGRIGLNRFTVSVTDADGRPVPDGTEVVFRISTLDQDTGITEAKTEAQGAGRFTTTGSFLSTVGLWEVAALVRRPNVDEVNIPFQFSMTGQTGQIQVRQNLPAVPVERGRELYQQNCAQCHGAGARGDGPLAAALNPRPFDLTVHVPLHTDQELHDWIVNGIPRTAMPPWKDQLSEEEVQGIINYLRQVAEQTNQTK